MVAESEAKELYSIFFSGCHLFIPLFDPAYDTFEGLRDRTPFCFDAILAVASKIRAGTGTTQSNSVIAYSNANAQVRHQQPFIDAWRRLKASNARSPHSLVSHARVSRRDCPIDAIRPRGS